MEVFVASPEIGLDLKTQLSVLPPWQDRNVMDFTKRSTDLLQGLWGRFIPRQAITRNFGIEQRMIVTDRDTMQSFFNSWCDGNEEIGENKRMLEGVVRAGRITIFDEDPKVWNYMSPELKGLYVEAADGNRQRARQFANWEGIQSIIAHAVAHHFEDPNLYPAYSEIGARFYQDAMMSQLARNAPTDESIYSASFLYSLWLRSFGNDIHRIYYGKPMDLDKKATILNKIRGSALMWALEYRAV